MEKNQETLEAYLASWKAGDFESMFELCQLTWKEGKNVIGLKNLAGRNIPSDYKIISSTTVSSVLRCFAVELYFTNGGAISAVVNVICESAPYKTAPYGTWGVNPVSALRPVVVISKPGGKAPVKKTAAKKK